MKSQQALAPAVIGAVGVVFGDIGTSPLYALGSALTSADFVPGESFKVLGLCSLIFWALLIMVTVKYVGVVMRADNAGEGGVLSLVALVQNHFGTAAPWVRHAVSLGVLGTALFYCDSLITPAISVLSAVEGLQILDPNFSHAVLPVTLVVIVILFAIQRRGTEKVGRMFGPVMMLWFGTLVVLGATSIIQIPQVLAAVNPLYGLGLLVHHTGLGLAVLGAVSDNLDQLESQFDADDHTPYRPIAGRQGA